MNPSKTILLDLKAAIHRGTWAVHSRLPTERDLAEKYAVNRLTARKALRQLVAEGWLYQKERSGTFVAPVNRIGQVLVVLPDWKDDRAQAFLGGIHREIAEAKRSLIVIPLPATELEAMAHDLDLVYRELAFVVFYHPDATGLAQAKGLTARGIPCGVYGSDLQPPDDSVAVYRAVPENDIAHLAFEALRQTGVRRFALIHTHGLDASRARATAFDRLVHAHTGRPALSLDTTRLLTFYQPGAPCPEALAFLQSVQDEGAGLFATLDMLALRSAQILISSGSIPRYRVVGVDGLSAGDFLSPPLCSVKVPSDEDGARVFHGLLRFLEKGDAVIREKSAVALIRPFTAAQQAPELGDFQVPSII